MSCKVLWCVFFIWCWTFYASSGNGIKKLNFLIFYHNKSSEWKCKTKLNPSLLVGDQFKIRVHYKKLSYLNNIGRCYKSQKNDFVDTAFRNEKNKVKVSNHSVTVTRAEDWKYVCLFYNHTCEYFDNNTCIHYDNVGLGISMTGYMGIRCTITIHVENGPRGYLIAKSANTKSITPSGKENIYKFYEGENINFTCYKTTAISAYLVYFMKDEQITNENKTDTASIYMTMGPEHDNTAVGCIIIGDETREVIRLKLIMNKPNLWVIVPCAALGLVVLLLVFTSVKMWLSRRKKDLPEVTFQNTSSDMPTSSQEQIEHIYDEPFAHDPRRKSPANRFSNLPIGYCFSNLRRSDGPIYENFVNSQ